MPSHFQITILRQDHAELKPYPETFEIPLKPGMTLTGALWHIRRFPLNINGKVVAPVVWQDACVRGNCTCQFLVGGAVKSGCLTRIEDLPGPILIEPLSKFKVLRDLLVDLSPLRQARQKLKAWNDLSTMFADHVMTRQSLRQSEDQIRMNSCLSCGACLEVCPQYNQRSPYGGVEALARAALFQQTDVGRLQSENRQAILRSRVGIEGCDNAQNCVRACPQGIPLTEILVGLLR